MKPNWEKFGRLVIDKLFEGYMEIDCADVQEFGLKCGILHSVPGGFDPDLHDDRTGILEPGDSYLIITESPSQEP